MRDTNNTTTIGQVFELAATVVPVALVPLVIVVFSLLLHDRRDEHELMPGPGAPPPSAPVSIAGAPALGRADAPVMLMMYADFQCPYCGTFVRDVLPEIKARYVAIGQVQVVFGNLPLRINPLAHKAAEAAACADRQRRLRQMHDAECAGHARLDEAALRVAAEHLGLDMPALDACLADGSAPAVDADVESAKALSISATPTFFVGTHENNSSVRVTERMSRTNPISSFSEAIARASGRRTAELLLVTRSVTTIRSWASANRGQRQNAEPTDRTLLSGSCARSNWILSLLRKEIVPSVLTFQPKKHGPCKVRLN
jgi:protein-disulfide isomerase